MNSKDKKKLLGILAGFVLKSTNIKFRVVGNPDKDILALMNYYDDFDILSFRSTKEGNSYTEIDINFKHCPADILNDLDKED